MSERAVPVAIFETDAGKVSGTDFFLCAFYNH